MNRPKFVGDNQLKYGDHKIDLRPIYEGCTAASVQLVSVRRGPILSKTSGVISFKIADHFALGVINLPRLWRSRDIGDSL